MDEKWHFGQHISCAPLSDQLTHSRQRKIASCCHLISRTVMLVANSASRALRLGSLCKPTHKRRLWELCLSGALQILDLVDWLIDWNDVCLFSDLSLPVEFAGRSATLELLMETSLSSRRLTLPMRMKKRFPRKRCSTEPSTSSCCLCRWRCVWWLSWQPSAPYLSTHNGTDTCEYHAKWCLKLESTQRVQTYAEDLPDLFLAVSRNRNNK